ncbi:MAG: hypothetical protein GXY58_12595 [Planctomycetaceae bacterium]|nr:hypothetical protein [Planctomycetaceae bacterium]
MANEASPQVRLILCDNEGLGRLSVGLESFFEFSFSLAEDLQDLVARHKVHVRPRGPHNPPRRRMLQ